MGIGERKSLTFTHQKHVPMNPKKLKRNAIITTIFFIVVLGNIIRMHTLDSIRAVDALQLTACGAIFGVLIVNVVLFMKYNDKK
jgi:hypothetical protein